MTDRDRTAPGDLALAVLRASLDAVVAVDGAGRVVLFNPAAEALLGHAEAEALGRPVGELLVPSSHRAAHEAGMARYMAGGPARVLGRRMEVEARHRSGRLVPVELTLSEGAAGGGRIVVAQMRDLSRRHSAASFVQALVDDQGELVVRTGPEGTIQFCNRAAAGVAGVGRDAVVGLAALPGLSLHTAQAWEEAVERLTPEAPVHESVDPIRAADGGTRWIAWSHRALHDAFGRRDGVLSVGRDITATREAEARRQAAERALAQSEARFAAFIDHAPLAFFLKDEADRYVIANDAAAAILGQPRDRIVGLTTPEVVALAGHRVPVAPDADREVRRTGRPVVVERPLMAEGPAYRHAIVMRFPVPAPDGTSTWIGGVALDVTAQREAEAALGRSRDALRQSEKMTAMGSLLAGVAHELNNPLAVVVAQADLLAGDSAGTALGARAEKIRRAAERCGRIVQTFLGLARARPAEHGPCDLGAMAAAAAELLAYPLRTAGIAVELALDPARPMAMGDADLLGQVVLNLLINAQQALERAEGPRRIRVVTRAEGPRVAIEVADTGPGVDPALRERIFEPFFSTKPDGVGTGVGLSFCRNAVAAHDGTIALVEGEPGAGATFRVTLPAAPARAVPERPAPPRADPARRRALVVDDEPELAEALAEMLAGAGYEVALATSGREAQARVAEGALDLILSDLRMPGMDGPAFYGWLLETRPELARRTVFVTGDSLGVVAARFLAEAGRPVLEKPFSREDVLRAAATAAGAG